MKRKAVRFVGNYRRCAELCIVGKSWRIIDI
jgi:hypothetical protein